MADAAGTAPPPPPTPQGAGGQQQAPEPTPLWLKIMQVVGFWMMFNWLMGRNSAPPPPQPTAESPAVGTPPLRSMLANVYTLGDPVTCKLYVSEAETLEAVPDTDLWWAQDMVFGDWSGGPAGDGTYARDFVYRPSAAVKNNGTVYAHVHCGNDKGVVYKRHALVTYQPPPTDKKKKRLLSAEEDEKDSESPPAAESKAEREKEKESEALAAAYISYWHPNLTLSWVYDDMKLVPATMPPQVAQFVRPVNNGTQYEPILYVNEFWNLKEHNIMVNDTVEELPLRVSYQPLGLFKWQLYVTMEDSMRQQREWGSMAAGESDTFKTMLMDTNPWLLALTAVVTILHSVFDFLAFKNDIQFWRTRKSVEGLSVKSIFTNLFFQTVILLYLFDNDTSYMILISSSIGLVIEFWKITKAVHVKVDREHRLLGIVPRVRFVDRVTYKKSRTKEYDELAFRTLSKVCVPLVVAYSVYSLVYNEHKGWYSWILSSLVGAIYTFGFILMTPQLFINYKLKSVAHMPWRQMTYKALNTFIDDLFAFIIKMPWLHRLACLRDDVIFFIYLYQRWKYPVDPNRRNEFEGGDQAGLKDDPPTDEEEDESTEHKKDDGDTAATPAAAVQEAEASAQGGETAAAMTTARQRKPQPTTTD